MFRTPVYSIANRRITHYKMHFATYIMFDICVRSYYHGQLHHKAGRYVYDYEGVYKGVTWVFSSVLFGVCMRW